MSSEPAPPESSDVERLVALERACELGLREHLPGLEIVDRHLELGGARPVDLLGVDGAGRPILIVFSDGVSGDAALSALEAVAFARNHAELIARHAGSLRKGAAAASARVPLAVLIAEAFSPRLVEQLAVVSARELALFEVTMLKGESRSSVGFRAVASRPSLASLERTLEQFLAALPPEERSLADLLARRLARLDERIELSCGEDSILWRLGEREVCRLDRAAAGWLAWVDADSFPIQARSDFTPLLDRVVRGSFEIDDGPPAKFATDQAQLLTPDEIAAFREP